MYVYKPPKSKRSIFAFIGIILIISFIVFILGKELTQIGFILFAVLFYPEYLTSLGDILANFLSPSFQFNYVFIPYLITLPLMLVAGILAYIIDLGNIGARVMTWFYIRLASGRIGSLMSLTMVFDFSGDWLVEQKGREEIDLTNWRKMFSELFKERAVDVFVLPALIAIFLLVILAKFININPDLLYYGNLSTVDFSGIIVAIVVIFLVCFYIPSMWILKDGDIKKVNYNKNGDIDYVRHISTSYKQGYSAFIGLSAILGFGKFAQDAIIATEQQYSSEHIFLSQTITNTALIYLASYIYAFGFFLVMVSWLIPGVTLTLIRYIRNHGKNTVQIRKKVVEEGICSEGTLTESLLEKKQDLTDYIEVNK